MSEQVSFVTEYLYCDLCARLLHEVLRTGANTKHWYTTATARGDAVRPATMIASKIIGSYGDGEAGDVARELRAAARRGDCPCHDVKIIVLHAGGLARHVMWQPDGSVLQQPLLLRQVRQGGSDEPDN